MKKSKKESKEESPVESKKVCLVWTDNSGKHSETLSNGKTIAWNNKKGNYKTNI